MWVEPQGKDLYVVKNAPFYVRGISAEDVVRGHHDADGTLRFGAVESRGRHSTVRVIMFDDEQAERALDALCDLGCSYEGSDTPGLFSVDVPPTTSWSTLQDVLKRLAAEGVLDWEEPAISSHHDAQC